MEVPLFGDEGFTPASPAPSPRRSRWVFALAPAALLALGAGNAPAQTEPVCSHTPQTGEWVSCEESDGSTDNIDISLTGVTIEVPETSNDAAVTGHQNQALGHVDIAVEGSDLTATADGGAGVLGRIFVGNGDNDEDVDIDVRNTDITTSGTSKTIIGTTFFAHGINGYHDGSGDIDITVVGGALTTKGRSSDSISALHPGDSGDITINVRGATLKTENTESTATESEGIEAVIEGAGVIDIDVTGTTIETAGTESEGISTRRGRHEGDINVDVTGGSRIETAGAMADGIYGSYSRNTTGDLSINVRDSGIETNSYDARGIDGVHSGAGDIVIDVHNSSVATNETEPWPALKQTMSDAIRGFHGSSSAGDVRISVTDGSVTTKGTVSHGIYGYHGNLGDIDIDVTDAAVRTESTALHPDYDDTFSMGIYANHTATGNVDVSVTGGSVETLGVNSHGILAWHRSTTDPERSIDVTVEGASVTARGAGANAVQVGRAVGGVADRAAALGADGYRRQTVRVNGQVYGGSGQDTAGVYLGGGGKVYIGPRGSVRADSGIAILATGSAPKLYLDMDLDGRRLAEVIGDDWIINDGGRTTIVVNAVTLHDERGVTGLEAPNGAFDLTMRREGVRVTDRTTDPWSVSALATGTGRDRDFSAGDFIEPSPVLAHVELASQRGSGGEWSTGERVEVRVRFSKRVRVETPAGGRGPEFVLIFCHEEDDRGDCMGGETSPAFAAYTGGAGTDTLIFSYTVGSSQDGAKSVAVPHFGLVKRDARIVSAEDDEAVDHRFQHNTVFNLFLRADDNRDRPWTEGETIEVIVRFRREVVVSTSVGTPTIGLQTGNGRGFGRTKRADYARVSNEDQSAGLYTDLVFKYRVSAADGEVRVVKVLANSLRRNGGVIRDRQGYDAALGHEEKEWSTIISPPLTVRFASPPERHDGTQRVKVRVAFSEPVEESPERVGEHGVRVEGGEVTSVRPVGGHAPGGSEAREGIRSAGGQEDREIMWEFEIEPDSTDDMTMTLEAGRPCDEPGAICTADGRALSEGISTTVRGPDAETPAPLTARVARAPAEHDGKAALKVRVAFSEAVAVGNRAFRDHGVGVSGGRVTKVRKVNGRRDRWELTVKPSSHGNVTVLLAPPLDCAASGALCTADGRALSNTISATVRGPVAVSVADARAREGEDETIDFAVSLSRAASGPVSVTYASADRTARAGEDYRARQGKLRFAPGETAKTVSVPVLDDAHDEGEETMRLRLSAASGAVIADGEATGTIENSDPMPQAWLARFGRTVAGHVTDAVGERLTGPAGGGSHVTLGGQRLSLAGHAPDVPVASGPEAADGLTAFADRIADRPLTGRELLLGSSFRLAPGDGDASTRWTAWGGAAQSRFEGDADGLALDGDVTTFTLGADAAWSRWLAGVALAYSTGEGGYRDHAARDGHPDLGSGTLGSTLTGVHPYARYRAGERLTLWGMLGYGTGDLTLTVKGRDGAPDTNTDTDTRFRMAAAGGRGVLVAAGDTGGFELATRTDAQFVRMTSEKTDGLAATTADASRLRLALEGSHRIERASGQTLTPSLEVGLRHDGGDAETGAGIEVGGGVRYADPALGLTVEAKARGLVAHEDSDYREWGASGSVRIDPGASGRGLSLTLAPTWGAASGGADRLWSLRDARHFAANDTFDPAARLDAEAGYGLGAFGGRGLMTPYAGFGLSETGARAWRTGVRWTLGPAVAFGVEGTRSEPANDDAPEHGLAIRATLRW